VQHLRQFRRVFFRDQAREARAFAAFATIHRVSLSTRAHSFAPEA
jgi:hypothetical protein